MCPWRFFSFHFFYSSGIIMIKDDYDNVSDQVWCLMIFTCKTKKKTFSVFFDLNLKHNFLQEKRKKWWRLWTIRYTHTHIWTLIVCEKLTVLNFSFSTHTWQWLVWICRLRKRFFHHHKNNNKKLLEEKKT